MSEKDEKLIRDSSAETGRQKRGVIQALRPDVSAEDAERERGVVPQVRESLRILNEACGSNLAAVIFFGSVLVGTSPSKDSAADLFVVVEDYEQFYRDLGSRLPAARRASIMATINRMLPPNVIYLRDPADLRAGAKCFVIDRQDLMRGLSKNARDHFCRGRLVQRVQIVYARTAQLREEVEKGLEAARRASVEWVPLYLPESFAVLDYCLRMLEVSYQSEIRPESRSRVREVFEVQKSYFRLMFGRILQEAVVEGRLVRAEGRYRLSSPPTLIARLHWKIFFSKSKVRATLRWVKYMLTFDDWLDYIARKAERRTGVHLELTKAERRFPMFLLWPKVFRVLKAMRRSEITRKDASGEETGPDRASK